MEEFYFRKVIYETNGEIGLVINKKFRTEIELRKFESFYERNINKLSNRDIHGNTTDTKISKQTFTRLL